MKMSIVHTKRLENIFFGKLAQRLAAYSFDDESQEKISRIAVEKLFPRLEVEFLLSRYQSKPVILCQVDILSPHPGQFKQLSIVADAAGMMNQMTNCNRTLISRNLR